MGFECEFNRPGEIPFTRSSRIDRHPRFERGEGREINLHSLQGRSSPAGRNRRKPPIPVRTQGATLRERI